MSDSKFVKFGTIGEAPHGLSTGNNKKYIRTEANVRGTHDIIEDWMKASKEEIAALSELEKTKGMDKDWLDLRGCFVPLEKGGESRPDEGWLANYNIPTKYFINWARGSIADMRTNAGFSWKNEKFYFRKGLTFSISGIYAPTFRFNSGGVFEAKGSGIFCESIKDEVLLGILCSMFARYQLKSFIKHSVDTSGDDIREFRLPPLDGEVLDKIGALVIQIAEKQQIEERYPYHLHEQREIDALMNALYGLSSEQIREIEIWYCRRYNILATAQGFMAEVKEKYKDYLAHCQLLLSKSPEYWQSHPINELIAQYENHNLDFKEFFGVNHLGVREDAADRSTLKTLAGFINADGGTVLLGVHNSGEIKGIRPDLAILPEGNNDTFELKIRNKINSRFTPQPTGLIDITFHALPEGTVCRIDASPSRSPTYFDNRLYVRDGNVTIQKKDDELTAWLASRTQQ